jgi:16S rRNA processing protein RimM
VTVSPPERTRILIGRIAAAHGIRGEVVVHSYAADPADIAAYGPLWDVSGTREVRLKLVGASSKGIIARVAGIADRTAAEALRGMELYVSREQLPEPETEEFYHVDLIGLEAVAPDGAVVGRIIGVENYGAGDLLDIRLAGGGQSELVPFTEAFVPDVDLAAGRVVVLMPLEADDDEGDEQGRV